MSIFLETQRLILRTPVLPDLDALVVLRSDDDVMKYTGEAGAQTKEQVKDYLNFAIAYQKKTWHGILFGVRKRKWSFYW